MLIGGEKHYGNPPGKGLQLLQNKFIYIIDIYRY